MQFAPADRNNTRRIPCRKNGGSGMRLSVGLLLVVASSFNAVQLVTEPASALAHPLDRYLLPVHIGVELALGLLVLSGLYWRVLRWCVLALFMGFAGYSLYLGLSGAASCGCFGPLQINPWWTFGLDVAIVAGLLISALSDLRDVEAEHNSAERLRAPAASHRRHQLIVMTAATVAISTPLLVRYASQPSEVADGLDSAGNIVVLEPEKWIGQRLPIADAVDADLCEGEWVVLLYRYDCLTCREQLPRYEERATAGERVSLVEVPPYGNSEQHGVNCRYAKLKDTREWFVQTPVEIRLTNGVVRTVNTHGH